MHAGSVRIPALGCSSGPGAFRPPPGDLPPFPGAASGDIPGPWHPSALVHSLHPSWGGASERIRARWHTGKRALARPGGGRGAAKGREGRIEPPPPSPRTAAEYP